MRNNVKRHNINEKPEKKVYNLLVEKLIRKANDNFIYFSEYETALEQVNKVLSIEPDNAKALLLKGNVLFCIDKNIKALEYYDKAINADPYYAEAYGSKAGTLDMLGRQHDALLCCEKAFENISIKDKNLLPSLYDQKLAILTGMKRFIEAKETLKDCIKTLSEEDSSYLVSCYENLINTSFNEMKRKKEKLAKMSLRVLN